MFNGEKKGLFTLMFFCSTFILSGQVLLPGTFDYQYYRHVLSRNHELTEPISFFPSIITNLAPEETFAWDKRQQYLDYKIEEKQKVKLINPTFGFQQSPKEGRSYNDGPIWQGKGVNAFISGGLYGKQKIGVRGYLSYTFNPIVFFAENKDYVIPDTKFNKSPYSYPFYERLDLVERFGDQPFAQFAMGQSEIKYVYGVFSLGFGTQNFNWGPSHFNPILLSNQAAGFPHFDFGLNKPINIKIGQIDGKIIWGRLTESDYYDTNRENNYRYITGIIGGYRPSFVKGLNIGIQRIMYRSWQQGELAVKDVFSTFLNTSSHYDTSFGSVITNDKYDQIASFTLRWNLAELGFEIWGEYARNDFAGGIMDFLRYPDRSSALTLGASESYELKNDATIFLLFESTRLSANQLQINNTFSSPTYYVHNILDHGYTQKGQLLGAGIGPGSNTHVFQVQYLNEKHLIGFTAQRIRFYDDYILNQNVGSLTYPWEFEIFVAGDYKRTFKQFSIDLELAYAHHYHRYFNYEDNLGNLIISCSLRYFLSLSGRG